MHYFISDVRNKEKFARAYNDVDVIVHTASLKQVPACEYNPLEAIKTNIDVQEIFLILIKILKKGIGTFLIFIKKLNKEYPISNLLSPIKSFIIIHNYFLKINNFYIFINN